ncbi:OLC1v1002827C1 [Oldenlandia corymbosa var. corymbosa]|uniref:OLC1v1002827C1 n=1 Tax=Oldenlandia corymbosa var. corymbosa TaxID=529605 RepID=A0AAV1D9A3_OLDCO|nr:OLC1v1002827C1 [Oldenlandia corymbosa var. corymbosa]
MALHYYFCCIPKEENNMMELQTRVSFLVFFLASTSTLHFSMASRSTHQEFVDAHNKVRQPLGLPPVSWSFRVMLYAKAYAEKLRAQNCPMKHSTGPFGENLAKASWNMNATEAVNMWAKEVKDYNYGANSCTPGAMCGHYTQLVWKDSVNIGCAKIKCPDGFTFVTCNYDPPGNYVGEKPY